MSCLLDARAGRPARRLVVVAVLALCLAGCGEPVVKLTGKVTRGELPIPRADVRLVSQERSPEVFIGGMTDEGGALVLDTPRGGVPVGRYEITVSWWVLTKNGRAIPEGEEGETLKGTGAARQHTAVFDREITPETSSLTLDVTLAARQD